MNRGNCAAQTESYLNLNFYTTKSASRCVNLVPNVQYIRKICTWKHSDGDLVCHCLATRRVIQVFLVFLVITWFFPWSWTLSVSHKNTNSQRFYSSEGVGAGACRSWLVAQLLQWILGLVVSVVCARYSLQVRRAFMLDIWYLLTGQR